MSSIRREKSWGMQRWRLKIQIDYDGDPGWKDCMWARRKRPAGKRETDINEDRERWNVQKCKERRLEEESSSSPPTGGQSSVPEKKKCNVLPNIADEDSPCVTESDIILTEGDEKTKRYVNFR
ncbi:hypothetical protein M758_UG209200 [Ceratodon purpureus]|nr:hypothetical protein M758_UG209200 [Ceratodon purpureus]